MITDEKEYEDENNKEESTRKRICSYSQKK